ncbi:hypothetical protein [Sphingomonas sp. PB4P5]|uniref:hypothetical protein n=1 Tax=Parasphingomonas puruogangriensis TaxID=3096155 RepID=UPI002FCBBEA2
MLTVIQADRDAAAAMWLAVFSHRGGEAAVMKDGQGDDGPVVQSFAANRFVATSDLYDALAQLEPYLDAIVCYASTQGEHEPNRLVANARAALAKAAPSLSRANPGAMGAGR